MRAESADQPPPRAADTGPTITVAVVSWRRPAELARCLRGLDRQLRPPDAVAVVVRPTDAESRALLAETSRRPLPVRTVLVHAPGLIAARNAALDHASTEIVAFLDDDAVPHPDWTRRIVGAFADDPTLGGVGGRDWVAGEDRTATARTVGKVQWFGRTIGAHHLGTGPPRDVDILKGCNMSFRASAIRGLRFDVRLRGMGDEDMAFSLAVRRRGWRLLYDPEVAIDHFPANRVDSAQDAREPTPAILRNRVYNETLTVYEHLPRHRRPVFLLWAVLIGTRAAPGLAQVPRLRAAHGDWPARLRASLAGRRQGVRAARR